MQFQKLQINAQGRCLYRRKEHQAFYRKKPLEGFGYGGTVI